jgi:hypothetical protein
MDICECTLLRTRGYEQGLANTNVKAKFTTKVYLVINLNFIYVQQAGPTEVIRLLSYMQQGARNVRNSKFQWPTETDMEPHGFDTGQGNGLRLERFCGTICLVYNRRNTQGWGRMKISGMYK